ncbi:hypothetical protein LQV63_23820 [Paenibacillus profundus]|uniref:ABC transporter substrate-binding protein n=1 Tax=Paenibacillus profundus TaxID=1173085 RepID=A0ABS8YPP5_9BACL|nr:hypothetical protein [Paenibacillus profundus]MCE5172311.1 hypothetical protein [Paenibacillus profundus]
MKGEWLPLLGMLLVLMILGACGAKENASNNGAGRKEEVSPKSETAWPRTYEDELDGVT